MTTLHEFRLRDIDGNERDLGEFKGKVALVVNVASRCGYTPQYEGLEALAREFGPKGLAVLGLPSNDFGAQEPGTEAEIKSFCSARYGVTFPLFAKLRVVGDDKHPVYKFLTESASPPGDVRWNFEKFLVGKDGKVVARFGSGTAPSSAELVGAIEGALGAPALRPVAAPPGPARRPGRRVRRGFGQQLDPRFFEQTNRFAQRRPQAQLGLERRRVVGAMRRPAPKPAPKHAQARALHGRPPAGRPRSSASSSSYQRSSCARNGHIQPYDGPTNCAMMCSRSAGSSADSRPLSSAMARTVSAYASHSMRARP
jgi:glutathione peroxidase